MADVLDIDNAEDFEVDDDGDRKLHRNCVFIEIIELNFFRGNFEIEGKSQKEKGPRIRS